MDRGAPDIGASGAQTGLIKGNGWKWTRSIRTSKEFIFKGLGIRGRVNVKAIATYRSVRVGRAAGRRPMHRYSTTPLVCADINSPAQENPRCADFSPRAKSTQRWKIILTKVEDFCQLPAYSQKCGSFADSRFPSARGLACIWISFPLLRGGGG
jgi:hypothetical protein